MFFEMLYEGLMSLREAGEVLGGNRIVSGNGIDGGHKYIIKGQNS